MLIPVLAYHYVSDNVTPGIARVTFKQFEKQMIYLRENGYRSLTLSHYTQILKNGPSSPEFDSSRTVLITFDDTYDTIERVADIMSRHGQIATAFVISDYIGRTNDWDYQFFGNQLRHAGLNSIRTLLQAGWEIGSHTRTHRYLPDQTAERIRDELHSSRCALQDATGEKIQSISYPFGRVNDITISIAREQGYDAGVTLGMPVPSDFRRLSSLEIPRIGVYLFDSVRSFSRMVRSTEQDRMERYLNRQRRISMLSAGTIFWKKIIT